MSFRQACRALSVVSVLALAIAGSAVAQDDVRGIDPNQSESLVEVNVPSRAAANELQLEADRYGVSFNDHYLRHNANGSYTVSVLGTDADLAALEAAGYEIAATIEDEHTWYDRIAERQATIKAETRANAAALGTPPRHAAAARRSSPTPTRSSSCASTSSRTTPAASSPSRRRPASRR